MRTGPSWPFGDGVVADSVDRAGVRGGKYYQLGSGRVLLLAWRDLAMMGMNGAKEHGRVGGEAREGHFIICVGSILVKVWVVVVIMVWQRHRPGGGQRELADSMLNEVPFLRTRGSPSEPERDCVCLSCAA